MRLRCAADEGSRESVDAKCKQLTASWVRERHVSSPDIEVCEYNETLEAAGAEAVLEPGVYTLQVWLLLLPPQAFKRCFEEPMRLLCWYRKEAVTVWC